MVRCTIKYFIQKLSRIKLFKNIVKLTLILVLILFIEFHVICIKI